jgi:uncharacterized protein YndB with AHSA1/START domain
MPDAERYDWSRFEIVYYYDRPLETVFRAWTTAAGLSSFFVADARFTAPEGDPRRPDEIAQAGDGYRWEWRHPFVLEGRVTDLVNEKRCSYTFTFGGMEVSITFSWVGEQTEVHLVQSNIPDTAEGRVMGHLNCRSCWIFFLVNLKSTLESGRDLRDASPDRVSSIEVGFEPLSRRGGRTFG